MGEQFSQKSSEPLNLTSCLEAFTTEEHLSDEEKYYCSKCKEHQPASKKLQIWRLPPILVRNTYHSMETVGKNILLNYVYAMNNLFNLPG